MDRQSVFTGYRKSKKILSKIPPKNGVIFVDNSHQQNNTANKEKVLKQVNNRIAQPVTETRMQTAKEGTAEAMYNPSGGFERF